MPRRIPPAAGRNALGRDAGQLFEQTIESCAKLVAASRDLFDAFELGHGDRALEFVHLIVRREEEWVPDFLLALVALVFLIITRRRHISGARFK